MCVSVSANNIYKYLCNMNEYRCKNVLAVSQGQNVNNTHKKHSNKTLYNNLTLSKPDVAITFCCYICRSNSFRCCRRHRCCRGRR